MDVHTKAQRSFNMSQIKSKNTKPELLIFSYLDSIGIKYKKHYEIIGKPDVAFPDKKVAVFIDGEFWHGKNFNKIKNKLSSFWQKKISENIRRDRKCRRKLKANGWQVLHLWDKKVNKNPEAVIKKIMNLIKSEQ